MKFLCPACERMTEISAFRVEGVRLYLACPKCGVESPAEGARGTTSLTPVPVQLSVVSAPPVALVAASAPAAVDDPSDPLVVPPAFCPKCIQPRKAGTLACAACGLVYDNYSPDQHRPEPELLIAWRELLSQWTDVAAHDRFLREAMRLHELPSAARLYRIRLARQPGDPMAERGRDEVIRLVTVTTLQVPRDEEPLGRPRWHYAAAALLGLVTLLGLITFLRSMLSLRQ